MQPFHGAIPYAAGRQSKRRERRQEHRWCAIVHQVSVAQADQPHTQPPLAFEADINELVPVDFGDLTNIIARTQRQAVIAKSSLGTRLEKDLEKAGDLAQRRLHTAGGRQLKTGSSIPQLQLTIAIVVVIKLKMRSTSSCQPTQMSRPRSFRLVLQGDL